MTKQDLYKLVKESNEIERIFSEPTQTEIDELERFINLKEITIKELQKFISVYQPDAKLRDDYFMDVRVGSYYPPFGGPGIPISLQKILDSNQDAYNLHISYEKLHPFTDGNGRSGRALWAWKMKDITGGFLLNFYFQTLQNYNKSS